MKILQINNYNYLKGGSEKVYQVSIELLKNKGHEVRYFSIADAKNEELCEGHAVNIDLWGKAEGFISKVGAAKRFIYNKQVARELDNYLEIYRPDIVHLHIFYGNLTNSIISVLRKHQIPMVQSVHEFRLLCPSYTCLDPGLNICEQCAGTQFKTACIRKKCIKSNLAMSILAAAECLVRDRFYNYQKNFAAFIMVSKFIQDKHIQYFPEMSAKCHQIYNSIDTKAYSKYIVDQSNKGDYFLYLGRLSYEKGIGTLIDVFAKNKNIKLKIVGDGFAAQELKCRAMNLKCANIEFLGFLSGETLYDTIAKARYTIIPSEWYENNPLSIIESLALGTPVIGSRIGGIPELINEGYNGYLHDCKNTNSLFKAIVKSQKLTTNQYAEQCRNSIRQACDNFDNEVYYDKLLKLYLSIKND